MQRVGENLATTLSSGTFISYDIEPFLPTLFSYGDEDSSAYPPSRSTPLYPLNIYYAWVDESADSSFQSTASDSASRITDAAVSQGQDVSDAALYGNLSRYINHASESDKRGCNIMPKILYVNGEFRIKFTAMRDIKAGEELFFNYGENFPNLTKNLLDHKADQAGQPAAAKGGRSNRR